MVHVPHHLVHLFALEFLKQLQNLLFLTLSIGINDCQLLHLLLQSAKLLIFCKY